jgi:hypothetical protein
MKIREALVDPILPGLDRQIQDKSGDLTIPWERFCVYRVCQCLFQETV